MKKYFFNINLVLLVLVILFASSCKKYITQDPITSTYDSKFWTSRTSVDQASLAMYKQLRDCFRDAGIDYNDKSYFIFGDLTSGIFWPSSADWNLSSVTSTNSPIYNFAYVPYLEGALKNWSRFYRLIAQCNLILEKVPAMPSGLFGNEAVKNSYLGEALFMRAFTYFYITRVWGDPVYISHTYNNIDYGNIPPVPRTAESTVLDSCINDVKKAITYLNYGSGGTESSIRANKGSANALLAHIYAWKHDYVNTHLACQEVINNGGYSLEDMDNYTNIWKGEDSPESIFEIAMKFNENGTEQNFNFFGTFIKDNYTDYYTSSSWIANKDYVEYLYSTGDKRLENILTPVTASGGDKEGYLMLKYNEALEANSSTYVNNNLVVFRLADIYLLDAEALAMEQNPASVDALNLVKERAGIDDYTGPTDKATLVNEILEERGRELIGEGQWFYDMIRTQPTTNALQEWLGYTTERVTQKGYYWPIDMSTLFKTNPLLTQNLYWANH